MNPEQTRGSEGTEERYGRAVSDLLNQVPDIARADIVVGIPFSNDANTLRQVVSAMSEGLEQHYPEKKCLLLAVGAEKG